MTSPHPTPALSAAEIQTDLQQRPVLTLQEYLRQFTDAAGRQLLEDSCAQVMISDGRLPAYKSAGVWLVNANEPFPNGEKRPPLTDPEFITLIEWGKRLGRDRNATHDWRKRGNLGHARTYQSRGKWLIHKDTPPPVLQRRGRQRH